MRPEIGKGITGNVHPQMTPQLTGMTFEHMFIELPSNGYENRT